MHVPDMGLHPRNKADFQTPLRFRRLTPEIVIH